MDDVRKMSDEDLLESHCRFIKETARRFEIMREYCEADHAYLKAIDATAIVEASARREAAREAYRKMEAERERP
jgi:hypothetical protein